MRTTVHTNTPQEERKCVYVHTHTRVTNNIQQNVRVFKALAVHAHDHLETVSPTHTAL